MPEPVRVRDNVTKHEYSTYAVSEKGEVYEGLTVIDEPAVDERGALLPPKYPTAEKAQTPAPAAPTPGRPATPKES
jgi:hypothetical protein